MQRVLKCDGVLVEKRGSDGAVASVTPADIAQIKAYVGANRSLTTHFDIVTSGKTAGLDQEACREKLTPWIEAGTTWWIEELWGEPEEAVTDRIRRGPPDLT